MLFSGYSCSEDLFSRYFAGKSVSVCWDLGQSLLAPFTNFTKSKSTKAEQCKKGVGRWRHSQEALYLENGSAKDLYPVYSVGRILLGLYSQPMLFLDKISTLRDFVGSLRPCTSTGENCPARYLENGSVEQLYPLNNIDSTAPALYSQPKLFWEIFDSVFQKFTSKLLKSEKFYMGKTFRLNISRTEPQNGPDY